MEKEKIIELFDRYLSGDCTAKELLQVTQEYNHQIEQESIPEQDVDFLAKKKQAFAMLQREEARLNKKAKQRRISRRYLSAAAIFLALITIGGAGYWLEYKKHHQLEYLVQDIGPGSNSATLTLSNGSKIALDEKSKGDIAKVSGITVQNNQGKLIYTVTDAASSPAGDEVNIISTPKGGQYELILQDGTQVWLNADSKITIPVTFNGREAREVQLSGEAYFQVSHNRRKPFRVRSGVQLVTVTGTHFNVSCYPTEKTQTTLAEGSVVVQPKTGKQINLTPGKQSTITISNEILLKDVNPDDYISWKDDYFTFVQTPMEQVLTQIGRWYNVSIDISKIPMESFDGRISRKAPLSQVLHMLEVSTDIKFKVTGRRIMLQ
jgi:transmembrane sensor